MRKSSVGDDIVFFLWFVVPKMLSKINFFYPPQGCWAMGQEHLQESRNLGTYLEETLGWMT